MLIEDMERKMKKEIPPWERPSKNKSKGKKFLILWNEEAKISCSIEVEAESKEEALKKWHEMELEEYDREEYDVSIDKDSAEAREVK